MELGVAPFRDQCKAAASTAGCSPTRFGTSRGRYLDCLRLRIQHLFWRTPYLHDTNPEICRRRKSLDYGVRTPIYHCGTVRLSEPAVRRLCGRRRLHYVDGRVCHSSEIQTSDKGGCAKE